MAAFAWRSSRSIPSRPAEFNEAYGGVYISVASVWVWAVNSVRPRSPIGSASVYAQPA